MLPRSSRIHFLFLLLFALLSLLRTAEAAILAIDYGSEFMKASLIKPGVPFDVLLNRDSKRKIQSTVAWKGDDRLFGQDAFNIASRFPTDSFSHLKSLLGKDFDSDAVEFYRSISGAELLRTERGTVGLRRGGADNSEWSVEELLAMQFAYVKDLAESMSSSSSSSSNADSSREPVRDVVLAVPPYFTQFERDAIVDALEIAGLRLLALVNDGTAVALNYAMTRSFPEREWHIVYDAGASGVRATVVSFLSSAPEEKSKPKSSSSPNPTTGKESTQITVAGVGFDRTAGGLELDRRLRDMLASDFETKHKRSIRGDARGMAKLWKEAGRIKAILSANSEVVSTVESLAFDIDYRAKFTRSEFEARCSDMMGKFKAPIEDALQMAGLTMENISSVILTGGHSRTPMVQSAVKSLVGADKIAVSVNADEASVLGAALYGASVSRQFRTKDIKVSDINPYAVSVSYQSESKPLAVENLEDGEEQEAQQPLAKPGKIINTLVFPAGSKVGSKKTVTFKRKDDFSVKMAYRETFQSGSPSELLEAQITGVKEAIGNLTEDGATDPVVKATVVLSESGFAGIREAVAFGEIKQNEGVVDKLRGLFGGGKNDSSTEDTDESTDVGDSRSSTSSSTSTTATGTSSSAEATTSTPPKKVQDTIALNLDVKPLSIPALTPSQLSRSKARLGAVDAAEGAKRRRSEAHNNLEAYLYRLRDLLENDDESPFMRCSKDEERRNIQEKMEKTLLWMHEDADSATLMELLDKRDAIERLERPIVFRYKEIEAFPSTLNSSQMINFMSRMFIGEARQNITDDEANDVPSKWTVEEINSLEKSLKEHEVWLNEWVEKQKSVKMNEDPVILTTEMKARAKTLENQLLKLMRRRVPPKPKKSSSSTTSSSSDSESTTATSSSAGPESSTTASEGKPSPHDEL